MDLFIEHDICVMKCALELQFTRLIIGDVGDDEDDDVVC